jgi:hypothetical protein
MIAAAVLLALSAILLYSRLKSKPEAEMTPPAADQSLPAPSESTDDLSTPEPGESAPEATPAPPAKSGAWEVLPDSEESSEDSAATQTGEAPRFTEIAKSSPPLTAAPKSEPSTEPQLASLKPTEPAALPQGVVFSIEDPALAKLAKDTAQAASAEPAVEAPATAPTASVSLPLPPSELGPVALRGKQSGRSRAMAGARGKGRACSRSIPSRGDV